jgi:type IV secretory pathway protease TraF
MKRRSALCAGTLIFVSAVAVTAAFKMPPKLIWNASASVPLGLYAVRPASPVHADELVVVMPPAPLADYLARRGYLPKGVPLLKHVLALPGQTVCRNDRAITVDGAAIGVALERPKSQATPPPDVITPVTCRPSCCSIAGRQGTSWNPRPIIVCPFEEDVKICMRRRNRERYSRYGVGGAELATTT